MSSHLYTKETKNSTFNFMVQWLSSNLHNILHTYFVKFLRFTKNFDRAHSQRIRNFHTCQLSFSLQNKSIYRKSV